MRIESFSGLKSAQGKQANRILHKELADISGRTRAAPVDEPRPRNVLLLQGLMGRLFRRFGQGLIRAGHKVFKVNFNGGDRLFWRLPGGIDYRGTLKEWPEAFRKIVQDNAITDVVLFGDCRAHHVPAIAICRELGLPVHVFEEGYIRPDWVTLELGGVNGHSELPSDPEWYRTLAAELPPIPKHNQVPASFTRRALEGLAYNVGDVFTRWYYPHWENHRPWHPLVEGVGWARKLWRGRERREDAAALVHRLLESDTPYYLFPLQLASDAQIRLHSPFTTMNGAIMLVLRSFAEHAPQDTRLVVKEHPLDNGVVDWREEVRSMAETLGVEERVDYLGFGDIVPVAQRARGMVTINSTSGTFALDMNVPVIALGQAIYDMPDLTFQHGIDRFWTECPPPDPKTFAAFRRVLVEKCLIPGGFFSEEALDKVVRHSVARLEGRVLAPE